VFPTGTNGAGLRKGFHRKVAKNEEGVLSVKAVSRGGGEG